MSPGGVDTCRDEYRSFLAVKSYGFIDGDDGESYLFHLDDVRSPRPPVPRQEVTFPVNGNTRHRKAIGSSTTCLTATCRSGCCRRRSRPSSPRVEASVVTDEWAGASVGIVERGRCHDGRAVESWRPPKTRCARWWLPLFWLDCWRLASWVACTEVGCRPNTGDGQHVQVIFGMDGGEQTKAHIFKLLEYFAS